MICSILVDARPLCPWDSPGKNTGVGSVLSYREPSPPRDQTCIAYVCLLRWQAGSLPLVPPGKLDLTYRHHEMIITVSLVNIYHLISSHGCEIKEEKNIFLLMGTLRSTLLTIFMYNIQQC